jgi:hypothetical protein
MLMRMEECVVGAEVDKSFEEEIGEPVEQSALVLLDVVVAQQLDAP